MSINALINKISKQLSGRALLAVFDRDGTLVPYNSIPEKAIFAPNTKSLIEDLAACPRVLVGLLSARDLEQLRNDFHKRDLILAGNYGMEIDFPDSRQNFINDIAVSARPLLAAAKKMIEENLTTEDKTILEDHQLTLCLHWHLTPDKHLEKVHNLISELKHSLPELSIQSLPTSYEIWPAIKWDKACGLAEIERILHMNWNDWLPFYAGDSPSDEAAFKWVNDRHGMSLHVGNQNQSVAQFQIESPAQMTEFLAELVRLAQRIGK